MSGKKNTAVYFHVFLHINLHSFLKYVYTIKIFAININIIQSN